MENILIRYGEITDYYFVKEHEQHIADEILRKKIENKEVYVVQEYNYLIGWLRYNLFWDNVPFMNKIYILETHRNRGVGKRLVKYWEGSMKRKGYKHVLTSTQSDEGAQHFYRKIGYTEIGGIKYLEDPFEIIFFKKIE
ncbi:MAG: GNAT family N-acetyltransferase [Treponema sp.]|jgi:ribosomal protein S18 acetylase RimI-like enzyme|nr:GNAT family N-acetyltransferase [Treponema sp.]